MSNDEMAEAFLIPRPDARQRNELALRAFDGARTLDDIRRSTITHPSDSELHRLDFALVKTVPSKDVGALTWRLGHESPLTHLLLTF